MSETIKYKLSELLFTGKCQVDDKETATSFIKYLNDTLVKFDYTVNNGVYVFISKM